MKKPKPRQKPPSKPTKKPRARRKPTPGRAPMPVGARRVEAALRKLDQAQRAATARGEDLLSVAHALGAAAVQKHRDDLVSELAQRELLRDLLALRDAFASIPPGSLPAPLEQLRLVPDAWMQWLRDSFALSPGPEQGELEVPASKLTRFSCDSPPPADANALVRVRVTCRGWNRDGKGFIPAQVTLGGANGEQ